VTGTGRVQGKEKMLEEFSKIARSQATGSSAKDLFPGGRFDALPSPSFWSRLPICLAWVLSSFAVLWAISPLILGCYIGVTLTPNALRRAC
jgi:hypothetical protein